MSTRGNQRLAKTTIPNIPLCNNLKWRSDWGLIGTTHASMIGKKQITIRDTIINVTNKCEILGCHLTHNSRELINYFEWPSDIGQKKNQFPIYVNQIQCFNYINNTDWLDDKYNLVIVIWVSLILVPLQCKTIVIISHRSTPQSITMFNFISKLFPIHLSLY